MSRQIILEIFHTFHTHTLKCVFSSINYTGVIPRKDEYIRINSDPDVYLKVTSVLYTFSEKNGHLEHVRVEVA